MRADVLGDDQRAERVSNVHRQELGVVGAHDESVLGLGLPVDELREEELADVSVEVL
jgi:hypothetical protein